MSVGSVLLPSSMYMQHHATRDAKANLHSCRWDQEATSLSYELLISGLSAAVGLPQAWNVVPPPPPARRFGKQPPPPPPPPPRLRRRNSFDSEYPSRVQRSASCRQAAGSCEPAGCGGAAHGAQTRKHADRSCSSKLQQHTGIFLEDCRLHRGRRWCLRESQAFREVGLQQLSSPFFGAACMSRRRS